MATAERRILTLAIVLASAMVAQAFGRFTWGVVLPDARDDLLDGSNTAAGLFGSLNVGAYLLGTIVVAWLASRSSLVGLVKIGLVLSTSGLALASFTTEPAVLAVALAIMGLGGAIIWVPVPGIAARQFPPERRGFATGIAGVGIGVGIVFAGRMAAFLRDGDQDVWQTLYRIELAIALVVIASAFVFLRSQGERPSVAGGFGGFGALRQIEGWKALTGAYSAYGFSYILVISFTVARLEDDAGWSSERATLAFTMIGFAVIVGGLIVGSISDRIGRRLAMTIAFISWAIASMGILTGSLPVVLVSTVLVGIMFSGIPATIIAHVVAHADERSFGPVFSATTLAFGVAQAVSPQIGGAIADWRGSFTTVFMLAAAVALLGALAAWSLPDETVRDDRSAAR
ncbi:MAG: MFS transporter [Actinomycetota bacterium]